MAIVTGQSGKFNISTANEYISGYVEWIETYDSDTYATTLQSTVTMKAYLHRTNSYNQDTYTHTDFYRKAIIGDNVIDQTDFIKLTIKPGGSYTQVFSASGVVQHNADGSATAKVGFQMSDKLNSKAFTVPYTETTATLTTFAVRPTISINGAGSSSNNRKAITSNGATLSIGLGSLGGRSSEVSYSLNGNDNFVKLGTYTNDGNYNVTIPSSIISSYPNTNIINMYIRVSNNMGGLMISAYLSVDGSVKPSISDITISSTSDYSSLKGLLVKQLTTPTIKTTASGISGSTVNSYVLASLTGFNTTVSEKSISANYTHNAKFEKSGSCSASVYVKDTRGIKSDTKTANFTVIDYGNPSMTLVAERCNSSGTVKKDGEYCKLSVNYNIFPIKSGNTNYNTKKLEYSLDGTTWKEMQTPSYNGTATAVFNNNGSAFDKGSSYTIQVRLTDISTTVNNTTTLPTAKVLESKRAGGNGITWGQIAEEDGYHFYNGDVSIHDNLYLKETSIFNIIYPVGSVYMSANPQNPKDLWGIGTWVRVSSGYLYAVSRESGQAGDSGNGTGTATNATALSADQMPSHQHYFSGTTTAGEGGHQHYGHSKEHGNYSSQNTSDYIRNINSSYNNDNVPITPGDGQHQHTIGGYTTWVGGSQGHTHNIPWIGFYVWYRTA